ncbi:hypothetical protein M271_12615 [Streptomyces rapamycinicus NRRL 5491]|nr:hypothetical protein M271_12615 [Streptomyces rapamycinicus NRRL 5491]
MAAQAIAAPVARAPRGAVEEPPTASWRETVVTARVWAPRRAAGRRAGRMCPAEAVAPRRRSSARAAAMVGGPAGVFFSPRSYAHTVPARAVAVVRAGRPAAAAQSSPAAVSPVAAVNAAAGAIRPDGSGRPGRSTASMSRSAQSLSAMPASYRHSEAQTASAVPRLGPRRAAAAPARASPGTVNRAETLRSSAQSPHLPRGPRSPASAVTTGPAAARRSR